MRQRLLALCIALFCAVAHMPTAREVHISIDFNVPVYPQLVIVPGYPVYYAPALPANYFFYDGLYWVLEGDNWYVSLKQTSATSESGHRFQSESRRCR